MLNDYFSAEELATFPGFGGAMAAGKLENSYHTFEANGKKYLILALEWGPHDEAVAWADKMVSEHPGHQTILLTHAYMYYDDTRYDWKERGEEQTWNPHAYGQAKLPGGVNDGQELWDKLVKKHPGFIMTLNGHVLEDRHGANVHQRRCREHGPSDAGQLSESRRRGRRVHAAY